MVSPHAGTAHSAFAPTPSRTTSPWQAFSGAELLDLLLLVLAVGGEGLLADAGPAG